MALKHVKYGIWFPWTELSKKIPYKSTTNSVGKGEEKVAAEFNTTIQGQNYSYDLPPNSIPGFSKGIEIKQLDRGSFRLGGKSNSGYILCMQNMLTVFNQIDYIFTQFKSNDNRFEKIKLIHHGIFDESCGKSLKQCFLDAEVSIGNIYKTDLLLKSIKRLLKSASNSPRIHEIFEPISGNKINVNSKVAFSLLESFGYSNDTILNILQTDEYNNALISICELHYDSVSVPMNLIIQEALDHVELLIVNEEKGYKLIDKENITFCRITSGGPRCKVKE